MYLCSRVDDEALNVSLFLNSHTVAVVSVDVQMALSSEAAQNDESVRRVERGSRIVTVVPQDTRLILQVSTELNNKLSVTHHSCCQSAPEN